MDGIRTPSSFRSWAAALAGLTSLGVLLAAPAVAPAAPPANDNVASAQVLPGGGGSFAGTNVDATAQAGEPRAQDFLDRDRATVWYSWTAPSAAEVTIDACTGADFHMVLAVYAKAADPVPPFTNLTDVGAIGEGLGDGGCATEYGAVGILTPVAGRTYYIQITGWAGTPGEQSGYTLQLTPDATTPTPPDNPSPNTTPNKKKAKKKCKKAKKGMAAAAKCKKKTKKKKKRQRGRAGPGGAEIDLRCRSGAPADRR